MRRVPAQHDRRSRSHVAVVLALGVATTALASSAPEAQGADEKSACVASYERSQVLRRDHRFQRARDELKSCSRVACPALVRNDCITWLDQVQTAFPSIAIRAMKDGGDVANVKVIEDNEIVATRLDGTSLEVEPGEHTFRFETEGAPPVMLTLVVREREKDRVVPVTFTSPHAANADDGALMSRPVPVGVYVAAGLGVVGLGAFAVLGGVGKNEQSSLEGTCSPNCSSSSIDKVRTDYIAADVGLGVGAAALVSAGVWYLLRPKHAEGAPAPGATVGVAPSRGGALVGWSGTF
jgi:hypothetical protein